MADELSLVVSVAFNKGGVSTQRSDSISVDVTGDAFTHQVQAMPTSNTALLEGAAIGTPGYIFIKNLDSANFVTVGLTGSYAIKIPAGEFALFRAAAAIFVLADTGTVNVEYWMIEA